MSEMDAAALESSSWFDIPLPTSCSVFDFLIFETLWPETQDQQRLDPFTSHVDKLKPYAFCLIDPIYYSHRIEIQVD